MHKKKTFVIPKNSPEYIELKMPKFRVESTLEVKRYLVSMGVTDMFGSKANFSALFEKPSNDGSVIAADEVIQKAFINVDENGTEAAAATAITFKSLAFREPTKVVEIDRPFSFVIRIRTQGAESGLNLFFGSVANPSST